MDALSDEESIPDEESITNQEIKKQFSKDRVKRWQDGLLPPELRGQDVDTPTARVDT